MTRLPRRRRENLIRLSLTPAELQALADLVLFAKTQGYHPTTEYAQKHDPANATLSLIVKTYVTMKAVLS